MKGNTACGLEIDGLNLVAPLCSLFKSMFDSLIRHEFLITRVLPGLPARSLVSSAGTLSRGLVESWVLIGVTWFYWRLTIVGDNVSNSVIIMWSRIIRRNSIRTNQVYYQLYRTNYREYSGYIYGTTSETCNETDTRSY